MTFRQQRLPIAIIRDQNNRFCVIQGIGKIKKAHFADMVGPDVLHRFRRLKSTLDPHWILGRGNLFDPKEP